MNKQLLKKYKPDYVLIHPENNDRSVFYAIVLAFSLKEHYKNLHVDFVLTKKYHFLREILPFQVGRFKASRAYDYYISLEKSYKQIWKYRVLKARVRFGVSMPLGHKFFDVLLPDNDNPRRIMEAVLSILGLDVQPHIYFKQLHLRAYIQKNKTLFITPYNKKITDFMASRISKERYDLLFSQSISLEQLLTVIIHQYPKVTMLNAPFDHFVSFSKKQVEILFGAVNHAEHIYSPYTRLNPIKYTCSPCNVDSERCPLRYSKKRYLCLKNGIYSF